MADPLSAISTAGSTIGSIFGGASKAQADQFNANIAQQNAGLALQQGNMNESAFRVRSAKQLGSMSAAYGASGVSNSGSAGDELASSAAMAELDAGKIKYGAQLRAAGDEEQAQLDRMGASSAMTGGVIGAAGYLTSGAAKLYGMNSNDEDDGDS